MTDILNTPPERITLLNAIRDAYPGTTSEPQRARMLEAMRQTGHITTFEAMRYLDVFDPRPRKLELVQAGHDVILTWRRAPTESGELHRVGVYLLKKGGQQ